MSLSEEADGTIVTINAGGKRFQTYKETLIRGSGYFQAYFEGGFSKPDPQKEIFLDMDPECFRYLLTRMRLPEYVLPFGTTTTTTPGIREAAAFLGMEMPELPSQPLPPPLTPEQQDAYDLAVRLRPGDQVEQEHNNWQRATFQAYNTNFDFAWRFIEAGAANYKYLWWRGKPQIRVTDRAERVKILARADPDLTRVVFEKQ